MYEKIKPIMRGVDLPEGTLSASNYVGDPEEGKFLDWGTTFAKAEVDGTPSELSKAYATAEQLQNHGALDMQAAVGPYVPPSTEAVMGSMEITGETVVDLGDSPVATNPQADSWIDWDTNLGLGGVGDDGMTGFMESSSMGPGTARPAFNYDEQEPEDTDDETDETAKSINDSINDMRKSFGELLSKSEYLSRKKVNGKWRYKYAATKDEPTINAAKGVAYSKPVRIGSSEGDTLFVRKVWSAKASKQKHGMPKGTSYEAIIVTEAGHHFPIAYRKTAKEAKALLINEYTPEEGPANIEKAMPPSVQQSMYQSDVYGRELTKSLSVYEQADAVIPDEQLASYMTTFVEVAASEGAGAREIMGALVKSIPGNANLARAADMYNVSLGTVEGLLSKSDQSGTYTSAVTGFVPEPARTVGASMSARPDTSGGGFIKSEVLDHKSALTNRRAAAQTAAWRVTTGDEPVVANVSSKCPIHNGLDLGKSANVANPYAPCTCNL